MGTAWVWVQVSIGVPTHGLLVGSNYLTQQHMHHVTMPKVSLPCQCLGMYTLISPVLTFLHEIAGLHASILVVVCGKFYVCP